MNGADVALRCAECGFDSTRWSAQDLTRTIAHHDDLIGHVLAGATATPPVELPRPGPPDARDVPAGNGVDVLVAQTHALMHHLDELAAWRRQVEPGTRLDGVVASVQVSRGGVPKLPVAEVVVDAGGLVGDGQANRRHHGRPWQAVSLYSGDVIDALAAEGHPIAPGGAGENLTLRGIDWSQLRGGLTIAVGDVLLRTSGPADPCASIAACFIDRRFRRVDHAHRPGWSRWYASVVSGGTVRAGDPVRITA